MNESPADVFAALGQPHRLAIFRLLARRAPDGVPAGEIAAALGLRPNVASVHLATLARAGVIGRARAGKQVLYRLDLARTGALIDYLALDCCRGRPELCAPLTATVLCNPARQEAPMAESRVFEVLFICSGNSARSIMAEAILNDLGKGRFRAHSAGTRPQSELNPLAVEKLKSLGHDVAGLRAKHVSEFQGPGAPKLDFVFTVCDKAANEECPPWPGQPISGHWGMPDPVKVEGTLAERQLAFSECYRQLKHRISAFASLPIDKLDRIALQREVDRIGRMDAPAEATKA